MAASGPGNRAEWPASADNVTDNRGKPSIAPHAG
jgi:hypothetical protein